MTKEHLLATLRQFFERDGDGLGLKEAFLFGSWAKDRARPESDVDVAVLFDNEDISDEETFERITVLTVRLGEALASEVSVIPLYHDFRKPALYYNAIVKGIPVYVKDPVSHVRLMNEALYHMEDFEIFGTQWQLAIARRNLEALRNG
jgi:predicted nucleotidyltransferase